MCAQYSKLTLHSSLPLCVDESLCLRLRRDVEVRTEDLSIQLFLYNLLNCEMFISYPFSLESAGLCVIDHTRKERGDMTESVMGVFALRYAYQMHVQSCSHHPQAIITRAHEAGLHNGWGAPLAFCANIILPESLSLSASVTPKHDLGISAHLRFRPWAKKITWRTRGRPRPDDLHPSLQGEEQGKHSHSAWKRWV